MEKVNNKEIEEQLEELVGVPDDDIDLSDIPEVLDWSKAVRGKFYRPRTINIVTEIGR